MSVHWPTITGVAIYVGLAVCGDILLSRGMKRMDRGGGALQFMRHVFSTPDVLWGIGCLALNFAALLVLLSWADISLIGPSRAASYLLLTLLAREVLHEKVTRRRWVGVTLITVGVTLTLLTSGT
jgi:drug/metabolite transporter (DMT)-like permease